MKKCVVYGFLTVSYAVMLLAAWSCAPYKYYTPGTTTTTKTPSATISPQTSVTPPPTPASRQPAEVRAVWVSDTSKLDWNTATINLQRLGFNTMYVNMATAGAAFYPGSKILPNLAADSRQELASNIELARRRGLQVHAKMIVLFMFKSPQAHQQQMAASNRVMRLPNGKPVVQNGNMWLCPSHPDNRKLLVDAMQEMVTLYHVDGVQYDYIRFSEEPSCYCSNCKLAFERITGTQIRNWPEAVINGQHATQFREWRKAVINDLCHTLTLVARKVNPSLIVSAAVFSDLDRAKEEKSQDWQLWLQRGYVDYVCTMNYTTNPSDFESLIDKQLRWSPKSRQIVIGIGSWKIYDMSMLQNQIKTVRSQHTAGFSLFSYDDMDARAFYPMVMAR